MEIIRREFTNGIAAFTFSSRAVAWLTERYAGEPSYVYGNTAESERYNEIMDLPDVHFDLVVSAYLHPEWVLCSYDYDLVLREKRFGEKCKFVVAIQIPDEYVALEMMLCM